MAAPILSIYPGETKTIQFLNSDLTSYVIPTGATVDSVIVSALKGKIADLTSVIFDAARGLVKVTLPDTTLVRSYQSKRTYYDLLITILNQSPKQFPLTEIDILYSPTLYAKNQPLVVTSIPSPSPSPTPSPGATTNPVNLFIVGIDMLDPIANKKYVLGATTPIGGTPTLQLQEIL